MLTAETTPATQTRTAAERGPFPAPAEKPDLRAYYEYAGRHFRYVPEHDPIELLRTKLVWRLLPRSAGKTWLDVGCGDGVLCHEARRRGFSVFGIDLAWSRLDFARSYYAGLSLAQGAIYSLPFADRRFDVVTSVEVLEHLTHPYDAFRELARVSRRYVLCTTPYRESVEGVFCPHCKRTFPPAGHLQRFDEDRFAEFGRTVGLRIRRWMHTHPMLEYRRFRYCPPLKWLIADYYKDSGFLGVLFEKP